MTLRLRQIVLAADDLEAAVSELTAVLGVQVAYRDPQVAEFGLHNALMPIGNQFLEVVSPTRAGTAAGRLLERRGDSGYMIILQTDDLARERARLDRLGVRVVWQSNYDDMRAVHLHPKDIGGAIVSLDQPGPPESWRWAGPDWRRYPSTCARRVLAAEIEAHDPRAMARRWAQVLDLGAPVEHGGGWRLPLGDGGALDFVQAGARGEGVRGFTVAVDDPEAALARAGARGLAATGGAATIRGTAFRLEPATPPR